LGNGGITDHIMQLKIKDFFDDTGIFINRDTLSLLMDRAVSEDNFQKIRSCIVDSLQIVNREKICS
jgi:divalent metal cation (Fe/Co/Zn/Cd) transporter